MEGEQSKPKTAAEEKPGVSDDIGSSMKYYISDTQVREIVGELLFPLISRAKEESEYTRAMGKRLDAMDKFGADTKKEVMALQTMNDSMKTIQKAQVTGAAELKAYQMKMELDAKKVNTTTDRCFYLLDKVERAHQADHDKIVRVQNVQANLENGLDKHKKVFYDQFEMQRNEFEAHLLKMKKKLKDSSLAVQMIQEVNKQIVDNTSDALVRVESNTALANELKKQFTKIATKKVEESDFQKAISEVSKRMEVLQKRIALSENENQEFGNFIINFLPIKIQNIVTENLGTCFELKELRPLQRILDKRMTEFEDLSKSNRLVLLPHILDQKKELLKKFEDSLAFLEKKTQNALEKNKQQLQEKKDLEKLEEQEKQKEKRELDQRFVAFDMKVSMSIKQMADSMKDMAAKGKKKVKKGFEGALMDAVKKKKKDIEGKLDDQQKEEAEEAEFLKNAYPADIKAREKARAKAAAASKEKNIMDVVSKSVTKQATKKDRARQSRPASKGSSRSRTSAREGEPRSPSKPPSHKNATPPPDDERDVVKQSSQPQAPSVPGSTKSNKQPTPAISKAASKTKTVKTRSPSAASKHSQESPAKVEDNSPTHHSRKSSRKVVLSQRAAEQSHHSIAISKASDRQQDQDIPNDVDDEDYQERSVSGKHQSKSIKSLSQQSNVQHQASVHASSHHTVEEQNSRAGEEVGDYEVNQQLQQKQKSQKSKTATPASSAKPTPVQSNRTPVESELKVQAPSKSAKSQSHQQSAKSDIHQSKQSEDPKESQRAATPHLQTPLETVKSRSHKSSRQESASQKHSTQSKASASRASKYAKSSHAQTPDKSEIEGESSEEDVGNSKSNVQATAEDDSDSEGSESEGYDSMDPENFYSKDEIKKLMQEEQDKVLKQFEEFGVKLNTKVDGLRDEINGTINYIETSLDTRIAKKIQKITADVEAILQAKQREKSDLQTMNMKLINGIDVLSGQVNEVNESIESICTISLCLLESQCMQVRADEQDEDDKQQIALMGAKDPACRRGSALDEKYSGDVFASQQNSQFANQSTQRSPRNIQQSNVSPRLDAGNSTYRAPNNANIAFPEPVGQSQVGNDMFQKVRFQDDGAILSPKQQKKADNKPKGKGLLGIDPACISCNQHQADIIKQFKTACLAYSPTPVVFRNIEFSRKQLLVFRKFLLGQCSKIVHLKEPYKTLEMSTKRVFDDMYLYLKQANMNQEKENIDDMNGLPIQTYTEITSQYWNLIYKSSAMEGSSPNQENHPKTFSITAIDLDQERDLKDQYEFSSQNNSFAVDFSKKHKKGANKEQTNPKRRSVFAEKITRQTDSPPYSKRIRNQTAEFRANESLEDLDTLNYSLNGSKFESFKNGFASRPNNQGQAPKTANPHHARVKIPIGRQVGAFNPNHQNNHAISIHQDAASSQMNSYNRSNMPLTNLNAQLNYGVAQNSGRQGVTTAGNAHGVRMNPQFAANRSRLGTAGLIQGGRPGTQALQMRNTQLSHHLHADLPLPPLAMSSLGGASLDASAYTPNVSNNTNAKLGGLNQQNLQLQLNGVINQSQRNNHKRSSTIGA